LTTQEITLTLSVVQSLEELGWDAAWQDAFEPYDRDGLVPARVAVRHHGPMELLTEQGRLGGLAVGKLEEHELPAVGDWVAARPVDGERKAMIEAVLPRRSAFTRKEAWRRTAEQVVAANVDVVFLVSAFGNDLNPRRIERYLTAAWESGATPVIVLNKLDVSDDPDADTAPIEAVAYGVPVLRMSAATGDGLDQLEAQLGPGKTAALLGSSGVGKSTLVNRLARRELLATQAVREGDERGRHTTTHRELVVLPEGRGLLLDTPGMRELQLWADVEALDSTFSEIAELAAQCRFADCSHDQEPGCAIKAALEAGTLDRGRWESYRKLERELRALEIRQNARLQADEKRKRRVFARSMRSTKY
jgi:ribosome biogenesis GTPase / thiamine phosphate phosphatase